MDLDNLFNNEDPTIHPYCKDCRIRSTKKPCHAIRDYEGIGQVDVLFLVDSLHWDGFSITNLDISEADLFDWYVKPILKNTNWTILGSVKCPDVREQDMKPVDRNACRQFLSDTIKEVKPKLIFTCGNLALVMLLKESGINKKRGSSYYYEDIPVVPLYHPKQVVMEPRRLSLFQMDIKNGYNKYILKDTKPDLVEWEIADWGFPVTYFHLAETYDPISIDIETTGLNFLRDKIQTVGISYKNGDQLVQVIVPMFHKEADQDPKWIPTMVEFLKRVCGNPRNRKILQNGKFDMKFLLGLKLLQDMGIQVVNVWDTMLMSHLVEENMPKSLRDLVKRYFPQVLDEL